MATQVTRSLKEINAEVVKLDNNIKSVTNENRALDKSLKLDPSSITLLTQKTANLKTQLTLATQKVDALKRAQAQMRAEVARGNATEEEYKKITLEVAKAEAQVKSFTAQVQKANNQKLTNLQNSLGGVSKAAGVALAAIAALGYKYAETGDEIAKASEKYNISAEKFQKNAFVYDRASGNEDAYAAALDNVQKQLSAAAKGSAKAVMAFDAVGISLEELEGLGAADALQLIVDKLSEVEDYDERVTLANQLLTTAGTEVAQVAELTAEQIAALNAQCEENGIISQESANAAAELKDRWDDFQMSMQAVMMDLGESLIPLFEALIEIVSVFIPIISAVASIFGAMPKGMQTIVAIILVLLLILPKLIGLIKIIRTVTLALNAVAATNPFILIAMAVALLIILLIQLANWLGKIFGKKYTLDTDTSSLGVDLSDYSATAAGYPTGGNETSNNTTNYYDYSTTNVEAHTDADIDDIAEQLSTKIKVGGN